MCLPFYPSRIQLSQRPPRIQLPIGSVEKRRIAHMNMLRRLGREEAGQDLVEYALLVTLIALGAIVAMHSLASVISDAFANAGSNLTVAGASS